MIAECAADEHDWRPLPELFEGDWAAVFRSYFFHGVCEPERADFAHYCGIRSKAARFPRGFPQNENLLESELFGREKGAELETPIVSGDVAAGFSATLSATI